MNTSNTYVPPDNMWFDKFDRGFTRLLCIAVSIAVPIYFVGGQVIDWIRGVPFQIPVTMVTFAEVPALDAAGLTYDDVTARVTLDHPTGGERLLHMLPGVWASAGIVAGALITLSLLSQASRGAIFSKRTVWQLRSLATITCLGAPLYSPLHIVVVNYLSPDVREIDLHWPPSLLSHTLWILVGMLLYIIAWCFDAGRAMRDDIDSTI